MTETHPTETREPIMLRADVTPEQIKALRLAALRNDTTMQRLLGELIATYLEGQEA